jgi:hypothetical protein
VLCRGLWSGPTPVDPFLFDRLRCCTWGHLTSSPFPRQRSRSPWLQNRRVYTVCVHLTCVYVFRLCFKACSGSIYGVSRRWDSNASAIQKICVVCVQFDQTLRITNEHCRLQMLEFRRVCMMLKTPDFEGALGHASRTFCDAAGVQRDSTVGRSITLSTYTNSLGEFDP